jgi:regulator of RNase E activity RraA
VDAAATSPLGYSETASPEAPLKIGSAGIMVTGAISDSQAVNALPIGARALGKTTRRSSLERVGEREVVLRR